jgi:hypothetical protein
MGGLNLYGMVGNDGVNLVDQFGMRPMEADETQALIKMVNLAEAAERTIGGEEFSRAVYATVSDITKMIASIKGKSDPASLKIGLTAIKIWADESLSDKFDPVEQGHNTCNLYVARVISDSGFEAKLIPSGMGRGLWNRPPSAAEWHENKTLGTFKVTWNIEPITSRGDDKKITVTLNQPMTDDVDGKMPSAGDIISYPGHIGIFLGNGLYLSSTSADPLEKQKGSVILKFVNNKQEQLYRSQ